MARPLALSHHRNKNVIDELIKLPVSIDMENATVRRGRKIMLFERRTGYTSSIRGLPRQNQGLT
jgi:hypothetical protein